MEMRAKIDKKLAKEILKRVDIDQAMRERFRADKKTWNYSIDKKNTVWLKKIVERFRPNSSLFPSRTPRM
ncbi:MAG: hypothetical protein P4L61_00845 [Candidatus Pacebacteria bacterium]|nr:hypothetical protein [Candidatus Paceibacterota bacterium]